MTNYEKENEQRIKTLFQEAQKQPLDSNPFLKTRILAELKLAKEKKRSLMWKSFAFVSPLVVAAALLIVFFLQSSSFNAVINQNILVKIEVKEIDPKVAFAEIELPDGVYFHSKLYPDISKKRTLLFVIDESFLGGHIPIVIKSEKTGSKKLKVNFLNSEQKSVEKRFIKINFDSSA